MTDRERVGRHRGYQDPADFAELGPNLEDPLERAAIALHRLSFETPDGVASLLNVHREAELAKTWAAHDAATRVLFRKRAEVAQAARDGWTA